MNESTTIDRRGDVLETALPSINRPPPVISEVRSPPKPPWLTLLGSGEFQSAHASDGDYVEGCYGAILQRAADAGGLASYTDALGRGALTRRGVAEALLGSEEYFQREIERAYQEFLGRAPDAAGRAGALAGLQSGQSVEAMRAGIAASQEAFDRLK